VCCSLPRAVYRRDPQRHNVPITPHITLIHRTFHIGQFCASILLCIRAIDPVASVGLLNWDVLDFVSYTTASILISLTSVFFFFTIKFWFGLRHRLIPNERRVRGLFILMGASVFVAMLFCMLIRVSTRNTLYTNSVFVVWSVFTFFVLVMLVDFFSFRLWLAVRSLVESRHALRQAQTAGSGSASVLAAGSPAFTSIKSPNTVEADIGDARNGAVLVNVQPDAPAQHLVGTGNGAEADVASGTDLNGHEDDAARVPTRPKISRAADKESAVNRSMRKLFILLVVANSLMVIAFFPVIMVVRDDAEDGRVVTYKTFRVNQWAFMWLHMSCSYVCVWYAWMANSWRIIWGSQTLTQSQSASGRSSDL